MERGLGSLNACGSIVGLARRRLGDREQHAHSSAGQAQEVPAGTQWLAFQLNTHRRDPDYHHIRTSKSPHCYCQLESLGTIRTPMPCDSEGSDAYISWSSPIICVQVDSSQPKTHSSVCSALRLSFLYEVVPRMVRKIGRGRQNLGTTACSCRALAG